MNGGENIGSKRKEVLETEVAQGSFPQESEKNLSVVRTGMTEKYFLKERGSDKWTICGI